jgi:outer membrane protein insertion porin family
MRRKNNRRPRAAPWCLLLVCMVLPGSPLLGAPPSREKPAKVSVSGLGWLRDHELRVSLDRLLGAERGPLINANGIDDAAFLLISALHSEGYLKPEMSVEVEQPDGKKMRLAYDSTLTTVLPRTLEGKAVEFQVHPGVWYHLTDIRLTGLNAVGLSDGQRYFVGETVLFTGTTARAYSPTQLNQSRENLQEELRRLGYADAQVLLSDVAIDDHTGAVTVGVDVKQGPRWQVKSLQFEGEKGKGAELGKMDRFVHKQNDWSPLWEQDVTSEVRKAFLERGYPDVTVRLTQTATATSESLMWVTVVAHVDAGTLVRMGPVKFQGQERTKESVLLRRVDAKPGEPLNLTALEQARYRLARLGVFEKVELTYDPPTGDERTPVFTLKEGRTLETSLLFGYGSYEELRGGVEVRQYNLFGLAHQSRLSLVESMKSSQGEYNYTVPEIFGKSVDGTARVFGLQRQELSFDREEYGGSLLLSRQVPWLGVEGSGGYTYQALRNTDDSLSTSATDNKQVNVASIDLNLTRDRRDNPLKPTHGYWLFAKVEAASRYLGGAVDYQRFEFGGSYHTRWGSGHWIHVGLTHGVITTFGTDDTTLPVNIRFYPGGDTSIRGYREGEAAPRGPDGRFIGAKSYVLANLEFEQALVKNFSVVEFGDALGTAVELKDYPFNEKLFSAGLGLRYNTLIGPLRAEYGRNLNRRPGDPAGTLLISVGFPF